MHKKRKSIFFYGGTGQSKVMRGIAESSGYELIAVLDDTENISPPFEDVKIFSGKDCLKKFLEEVSPDNSEIHFLVTIGNPHAKARIEISKRLEDIGYKCASLVHASAIVDHRAVLGKGNQVHPGAIINSHAKIGNYCIINTRSLIEHDDVLMDGVGIGPGAILCGNVKIGKHSWIGAGSIVRQNITIGSNCIIGAGSVVVNDIPDGKIVVGNPAKRFLSSST